VKIQILLPVHTYADGNADRFALHAAAIARHLDADVHALVLNADFPRVSSALGNLLIDVPALIGGAKAKSRERGSAVIQAMKTEMGPLGISLRTTQIECFPGAAGDVVSSIARYHDLVLVGIGASDVTPQATAEAAIFGSGRPTLLVPEDASVTTFGHVLIAWDGSRVAARAVSDARDFLQRAANRHGCVGYRRKGSSGQRSKQPAGGVSLAARYLRDSRTGADSWSPDRRNSAGACAGNRS